MVGFKKTGRKLFKKTGRKLFKKTGRKLFKKKGRKTFKKRDRKMFGGEIKKCADCRTKRNEESELQAVPCCNLGCCTKYVCWDDKENGGNVKCRVKCNNCQEVNIIGRECYTKNRNWFQNDYRDNGGFDHYGTTDLEKAYKKTYPAPGESYFTCGHCEKRNILPEKWNIKVHDLNYD